MIGIVKYGEVTLDLTKINSEHHRPIMSDDGASYLYTEIVIDMNCMFSPSATSYTLASNNAIPQAGGNVHAAETNRALFTYLSQPRRVLKMFTYNQNGQQVITLQSPPTVAGAVQPSDCKTGPICKVFSVTETFGVKTYDVHLQFTTWINYPNYDKASPILDNRWETFVDYDQDFFQTTVRRGTTKFNVGRLMAAGLSPDHFREQLFQTPAPNFKRTHVSVNVSSDCSEASWTVIDVEQPFNLGTNSPATRVEAMLTTWVKHGSLANAVAQSAPQINQAIQDSGYGLRELGWDILTLGGASGTRRAANIARPVLGNSVGQLPSYFASITVRAHGARTSRRADLATLCWAITHSWLGNPTFFDLGTSTEFIMTHDVAGKFVELRVTFRWAASIVPQILGMFGQFATLGAIYGSILSVNSQAMNFMTQFYLNNDGTPFTENDIAMDGESTCNLSQASNIGNRPMNTGQRTTNIPDPSNPQPFDFPNANSPYRWSRAPGDLQYMLTAVLRGEPNIAPPVGPWEGLPVTPVPPNGVFTVPPTSIPILPRA